MKFPLFSTVSLGLSPTLPLNAAGKLSMWGARKQNITVGLDPTTIKRCITYLGHMIPLIFSHSGIIMKSEMHHVFHIPNFISKPSYLTTWTSSPGCPKDISSLNVWKWSWSPRHTYLTSVSHTSGNGNTSYQLHWMKIGQNHPCILTFNQQWFPLVTTV